MRTMSVVVVAALVACGPEVKPQRTTPSESRAAVAERQRIAKALARDPAQAMIDLGIPVDEFVRLAADLYTRWKAENADHPAFSTPAPAPRQPWAGDTGVKRWCFLSESGLMGVCGSTAAKCESMRSSHDERGTRPCQQWDPVNCFLRESITESGVQELLCTPQSDHCSLLIEWTETRETGWRVASGCARY